jgi:hypothetical protein
MDVPAELEAEFHRVYEVDDPSVPGSDAWRAASDSGSWKERIRPHTTNRAHATYERVGRASAD